MHREVNSAQILLSATALLALVLVLFSDFLGTPFGGYADQRFVLSLISGLLIPASILAYARYWPVSLSTAVSVLCPTLVLCLAFVLLALPFRSQLHVWVEPGMYGFFFLAAIACGAWLAWSGRANSFARRLILIVAAVCTFYGLASINVYLFATFDGVTKLIDFIPWGFVN